jgi:two-component system LytT family response regulator
MAGQESDAANDGGGHAANPNQAPPAEGRAAPFINRLLIHNGLVDMNEIRWIAAERSYARVHLTTASYPLRVSLGRLSERLDPQRFARIHRSTIVNLDHVHEVVRWFGSDYLVRLRDGAELRLSRSYWRGIKERLILG